ncbi:universal stress protein [Microbispora sp. ATCC PTA-5024]|uniref:universal stress protein n=1 Tax=Microbispora sp. ATCC PTA-5024 TaxID=316330 RepID=UPI0003DD7D08|nr:universal stress protein [Microbispora sp. ATCC PTA-5024]ETK37840.1 universal stress protein A [Microbispora sp. ATCC PTA-5024]
MSAFEIGTDGPQVIVVGIDGSDTSLRATAYAWGLARRQGSKVVLVHVTGLGAVTTLLPAATVSAIEAGEEYAAELRERVERFAAESDTHVPYAFRTEQGEPSAVLTRVADELRADAVVVGASAQAGHRFIGSVAVRLVRAGRWPVTVVP